MTVDRITIYKSPSIKLFYGMRIVTPPHTHWREDYFYLLYITLCSTQVNSGARLLHDVRNDLSDIIEVCEGRKKQTNHLRTLISDLTKGV